MAVPSVTVVPLEGCDLAEPLKFSGDGLNIEVDLIRSQLVVDCNIEEGEVLKAFLQKDKDSPLYEVHPKTLLSNAVQIVYGNASGNYNLVFKLEDEPKDVGVGILVGIQNRGTNTCYMNAVLQLMFSVKRLRSVIEDYETTSDRTRALYSAWNTYKEQLRNKRPVAIEISDGDKIQITGTSIGGQHDTGEFIISLLSDYVPTSYVHDLSFNMARAKPRDFFSAMAKPLTDGAFKDFYMKHAQLSFNGELTLKGLLGDDQGTIAWTSDRKEPVPRTLAATKAWAQKFRGDTSADDQIEDKFNKTLRGATEDDPGSLSFWTVTLYPSPLFALRLVDPSFAFDEPLDVFADGLTDRKFAEGHLRPKTLDDIVDGKVLHKFEKASRTAVNVQTILSVLQDKTKNFNYEAASQAYRARYLEQNRHARISLLLKDDMGNLQTARINRESCLQVELFTYASWSTKGVPMEGLIDAFISEFPAPTDDANDLQRITLDKAVAFCNLPEEIFIAANRTGYDSSRAQFVTTLPIMPSDITLQDLAEEDVAKQLKTYELKGACVHSMFTNPFDKRKKIRVSAGGAGHYVAYVKSGNSYYEANDALITQLDDHEEFVEKCKMGSLFLYVRKRSPAPLTLCVIRP